MEEGFVFGHRYENGVPWAEYLEQVERMRLGVDLPDGFVETTFLVADVDREIVGRASIRHRLNHYLATEGGHIGYWVLAAHRRRGYATEILRQSLVVIRAIGVERVLVTCDEDNVGSATVIERCGGEFEGFADSTRGGPRKRRYWID